MQNQVDNLVRRFYELFPDSEKPVIARAPGRINLLGQHIDHQGGFINPIAINKHIYIALSRRNDSLVYCKNLDPVFGEVIYELRDFIPEAKRTKWMDYVARRPAERLPRGAKHWARYILSAIVYFHRRLRREESLKGYNILLSGDIPIAAGVSSSSAIVVATGLALCELHNFRIPRLKLAAQCGRAEFFVGTLSGFGDQSAILLAREHQVAHFMFFPLRLLRYVRFPEEYTILLCQSGERAEKSASVRQTFNHRVASYHFARLWLKQLLPPTERDRVHCLRYFLPERESEELAHLYALLKHLPENVSSAEIRNVLSAEEETVERLLQDCSGHKAHFDLRGVCLFGLSEMARARRFIRKLAERKMSEVAQIMNISHNGDRLIRFDPKTGESRPFYNTYSDKRLDELAHSAQSRKRATRQMASLWRQPGRYRCSTHRLDQLVDIVLNVAPTAGAYLAGGGLGGAIIVICHNKDTDHIINALERNFYIPNNMPVLVEKVVPSPPAEIIRVAG
ncbi:hypothetical protein J7M23_07615 [Candidatus Sumerlaeota bacterium]|nr:hypothetical protein [Candidatus Sumerlaeota bacterium]